MNHGVLVSIIIAISRSYLMTVVFKKQEALLKLMVVYQKETWVINLKVAMKEEK